MKKDTRQEAFEKYKQLKKDVVDGNKKLSGINKVKFFYPFTKQLLKIITFVSGEKIYCLNKQPEIYPKNRTIIFANTHRFKPDFEKITIKTKQPSFVVASDFINSYGNISGWYFNTRSTVFVDPYSKDDKKTSFLLMKKYLENGLNCTIFPEAVWNLSPNRIMLDTFYGTVKLALETNSIIVCTAIERYNKNYYINRGDYLDLSEMVREKYGQSYESLDDETKKEVICETNTILRDRMATLLFDIWEYDASINGLTERKKIEDNYWDIFVKSLTGEWPGYKMSDNDEQQFQNQKILEQKQVEEDIKKLRKSF